MLTLKPTTINASRLLNRWNTDITEATNCRDKAALRALAKLLTGAADTLVGTERQRALALVARADASLRYLKTWWSWRGERRLSLRATRRTFL